MQNNTPNQGQANQQVQVPQKRKVSGGNLMWRLLSFSFVVFFVMVASYVGLQFGYMTVLENKNERLKEETSALVKSIPEEKREQVVDFYSRLSNMDRLLDSHIYATNFFSFLESNTDSGVYFTESSFSVEDGEVILTGFSRDYEELARQLERFRVSDKVENLQLDSAVRSQNGLVSFELKLTVSSSLFRS